MCRFCMIVLAVFVGCTMPAGTKILDPFVAVAGQYSVMDARSPEPSPPDSDVCPACNGAGVVGDGRVMTKCLKCDGTGKRKKECQTKTNIVR